MNGAQDSAKEQNDSELLVETVLKSYECEIPCQVYRVSLKETLPPSGRDVGEYDPLPTVEFDNGLKYIRPNPYLGRLPQSEQKEAPPGFAKLGIFRGHEEPSPAPE